ncbi:MAG TPA: hypothetical protein VMR14_19850 [Streptosporangiaceae bacterium]|jgi:hypothetical protein|nr:hypothetical protein [Streptosporangiaceae bacterium]
MSRSLPRLAVRARVLLPVAVAVCALLAMAGVTAPASGAVTRLPALIPAIVNPRPVPVAYAGSQAAGYPFCADIVPVNPITNAFGTPLIATTANCNETTPEAYAMAVSPDGRIGYVVTNQISSCANGYVVPINLVSGQAYAPIPVGYMNSYNAQVPGGIAITPPTSPTSAATRSSRSTSRPGRRNRPSPSGPPEAPPTPSRSRPTARPLTSQHQPALLGHVQRGAGRPVPR